MTKKTPKDATRPRRRNAWFFDGGFILVITGIACLGIVIWALAPILFNTGSRGPGDGKDIHSYGFVLSNLRVNESDIKPALNYRGYVRAMDLPAIALGSEVQNINSEQRGKMVVSSDTVVGVIVNGEIRAYPMRFLQVHEVINDELGGHPIAVTYSPVSDSVAVYSRVVDEEVLEFDVSGLVYNCNLLMFDRRPEMQGESLWCQLAGTSVAGPLAKEVRELTLIPSYFTTWENWLADQPNTTIIKPDPRYAGRYKKTNYEPYFKTGKPAFPVNPMAEETDVIGPMDRVMVVDLAGERRIYPVNTLLELAKQDSRFIYQDIIQGHQITFEFSEVPPTVFVDNILQLRPGSIEYAPQIRYSFWFAWHAIFPGDIVWQPRQAAEEMPPPAPLR